MRPSYLYNGIPSTGNAPSLYSDGPQQVIVLVSKHIGTLSHQFINLIISISAILFQWKVFNQADTDLLPIEPQGTCFNENLTKHTKQYFNTTNLKRCGCRNVWHCFRPYYGKCLPPDSGNATKYIVWNENSLVLWWWMLLSSPCGFRKFWIFPLKPHNIRLCDSRR